MNVQRQPAATEPVPTGSRSQMKVVQVGNSLGLVLPKEVLAQLKVERGDSLYLVASPDGFLLTPYDPAVTEQVEAGKRFMKKYRDTFHALAR